MEHQQSSERGAWVCEWKMWWFVIFLVRSFWSAIQHTFPPQKRVKKNNLSYSQKCWTLHPSRKKNITEKRKTFFWPKPTRAVAVMRCGRGWKMNLIMKFCVSRKSVADMCRRQQLNLWTQLRSDLRLFGSSANRKWLLKHHQAIHQQIKFIYISSFLFFMLGWKTW